MAKINTLVFAGGAIHDWKGCSDEIVKVLSQRDEFEITRVRGKLGCARVPEFRSVRSHRFLLHNR